MLLEKMGQYSRHWAAVGLICGLVAAAFVYSNSGRHHFGGDTVHLARVAYRYVARAIDIHLGEQIPGVVKTVAAANDAAALGEGLQNLYAYHSHWVWGEGESAPALVNRMPTVATTIDATEVEISPVFSEADLGTAPMVLVVTKWQGQKLAVALSMASLADTFAADMDRHGITHIMAVPAIGDRGTPSFLVGQPDAVISEQVQAGLEPQAELAPLSDGRSFAYSEVRVSRLPNRYVVVVKPPMTPVGWAHTFLILAMILLSVVIHLWQLTRHGGRLGTSEIRSITNWTRAKLLDTPIAKETVQNPEVRNFQQTIGSKIEEQQEEMNRLRLLYDAINQLTAATKPEEVLKRCLELLSSHLRVSSSQFAPTETAQSLGLHACVYREGAFQRVDQDQDLVGIPDSAMATQLDFILKMNAVELGELVVTSDLGIEPDVQAKIYLLVGILEQALGRLDNLRNQEQASYEDMLIRINDQISGDDSGTYQSGDLALVNLKAHRGHLARSRLVKSFHPDRQLFVTYALRSNTSEAFLADSAVQGALLSLESTLKAQTNGRKEVGAQALFRLVDDVLALAWEGQSYSLTAVMTDFQSNTMEFMQIGSALPLLITQVEGGPVVETLEAVRQIGDGKVLTPVYGQRQLGQPGYLVVYGVSFPDAFEDKLFRKVLLRQLAAVTGDFPADQVSQMVVRAFQEYTNGMVSVPGIAIMTAALASTRDGGREFQSPA